MTSVSERAVGKALREARRGRSCNDFAQIFVLDSGGQPCPLLAEALGGLRRPRFRPFEPLFRGLRESSCGKPDPLDTDAFGDLPRPARQLEGPDRVGRVDVQRPVSSDAGGPSMPGDRLAHGLGPSLHEIGDSAGRPEAPELPLDLLAELFHRTTVPASPASTSTSWSGSAGHALSLVLVIMV